MNISDHNFDDWVRQYQRLLFGIAYWWTGSRSDAEELTQEAFFQAYRSRSSLREIAAVKAWLVGILRHCYAQMYRKGRSRIEISLDEVMEKSGETMDFSSNSTDPHDFLALRQALERLDERHRLPLVLFYFQELSYREVAEALDLPLGTVMSRLSRARQLLHTSLAKPAALKLVRRSERMNCDLYRSEMYAWRPGSDEKSFQPLYDHLENCADCARLFEQLTASDEGIRRTFQSYPQSPFLEGRILSGLAHQRTQAAARRQSWRSWLLAPALVSLLIVLFVWIAPRLQQARLTREMAILLSKPPALEINSTDRKQLLEWSASQLEGSPTLPPALDRVEFRGAAAINVATHKAVLLKMENEERASLVIVDAPLTQDNRFHSLHEGSGSASLWSDGKRSYVLLFNGTDQELQAYMTRMGITA